MDVSVVQRALACLELAPDTGRGLDGLLARLMEALSGLPGLTCAAVVLADTDHAPSIRAQLGAPDVGLLLGAALERGEAGACPRVLRRDGRADTAAMLAAPVCAGSDMPWGWLFVDGPVGPLDAAALRLVALLAEAVAAMVRVAAQGRDRNRSLAQEVAFLRSKVSLRYHHVFSTGISPLLDPLRAAVDRAALADGSVAVLGEDGSGRGVLARLIHELSPRAVRLFSVFDAAGAQQAALRLFGGSRGLDKPGTPGLLEETDGGTLLIEQAHRLPPEVCERLCRYLADGSFNRLGGGRNRSSRTRVLFTAPPQGLGSELAATPALAVIRVPSLRERPEDIPALLDDLLSQESARDGRRLSLTPKALKALEAYDWPGNIRELRALVSRLAVTAPEDRIDIADIPTEMLAEGERPQVLPEDAAELRDMERQQVLSALTRHNWVQSRAARELGLTLRQIGYRIRKYGLAREDDETA
ncbi:MAG: sigma 54-interacting transcriptional regulator [Solidesulfovibrio sp. DCME]|uniref:sigma 54-interacting transcriptional regulator n=1 Tax=Solidesulfovibrio sp. DCME TaxID=3447380 RepID=UPI003D1134B9